MYIYQLSAPLTTTSPPPVAYGTTSRLRERERETTLASNVEGADYVADYYSRWLASKSSGSANWLFEIDGNG